ncbi:TRAP transporter substrate-binding protein [Bordetella sp. 15P40C-2]|uniref:TRAP transporter substrate-binding protein n=1 Tax=Bordetella sp. 15P40C-2 TaxID=2572246 RepID=UPI001324ADA8|nr:TRAP transporter substrate-binding protein [Bordetella sp. 15P40C-2]MVW72610.1 C4-dicarboxylate ABC transporter substrate-binding protein [Bordetella sp. 15P40C-2]
MKKISRLAAFCGVACSMLFASQTVSAAKVKWDLTNDYQASSLSGQMDQMFAKKVNELTDGRVTVNVHLGGSLGYKSADALDAVETGAVQIADSSSSFWGGLDPLFKLTSMPFVVSTYEEARILYDVARPYYEKALLERNQYLLYVIPWAPSGLWTRKPINNQADLANLRIRTYDPNGIVALRAIGAAPLQTPIGDVMPMLATNALDGVLTAAEGGAVLKFWEQLPHYTAINYAMSLQIAAINKDAFDDLSEADRKAVMQAAKDTEDFGWNELKAREVATYELMRKNNVTIATEIDPAFMSALRDTSKTIQESWLKETGERGQKILNDFNARKAAAK